MGTMANLNQTNTVNGMYLCLSTNGAVVLFLSNGFNKLCICNCCAISNKSGFYLLIQPVIFRYLVSYYIYRKTLNVKVSCQRYKIFTFLQNVFLSEIRFIFTWNLFSFMMCIQQPLFFDSLSYFQVVIYFTILLLLQGRNK